MFQYFGVKCCCQGNEEKAKDKTVVQGITYTYSWEFVKAITNKLTRRLYEFFVHWAFQHNGLLQMFAPFKAREDTDIRNSKPRSRRLFYAFWLLDKYLKIWNLHLKHWAELPSSWCAFHDNRPRTDNAQNSH